MGGFFLQRVSPPPGGFSQKIYSRVFSGKCFQENYSGFFLGRFSPHFEGLFLGGGGNVLVLRWYIGHLS